MTTPFDIKYKQDPSKMKKAALTTFFNIVSEWELSDQEAMVLLGLTPHNNNTFCRWKLHPEQARLTKDTFERISYIFGIYKALVTIFPSYEAAGAWVHRPNQAPPFNGQPALKRMLAGNVSDLYVVRQYLDARQNCW